MAKQIIKFLVYPGPIHILRTLVAPHLASRILISMALPLSPLRILSHISFFRSRKRFAVKTAIKRNITVVLAKDPHHGPPTGGSR